MTGTSRHGRGQALAEFALVFPILVLLMVALFDLGRIVVASNSLTNGVREGARLAIVNQDLTRVQARVRDQVFTITPTVSVAFRRVGSSADPEEADPEEKVCDPIVVGCVAVVRGTATVTPITPIIGAFIGPIPLTAVSQAPVEFVCPNPAIAAYQSVDSCPRQP